MMMIRLRKQHWGRAWRAMIEIGPVRMIARDPVYEVLPAHLDLLKALGIPYELVKPVRSRKEKQRHATSD